MMPRQPSEELMEVSFKDLLKTFDGFKNKQQKCIK